MMLRWIAITALLAGCATSPDSIEVDLSVSNAKQPGTDTATIELAAASRQIRVTGVMTTPSPCFSLAAVATRIRATLVVELKAVQHRTTCFDILAGLQYDLTLRDVPAGRYDVVVNHVWPNQTTPAGTGFVDIP